MECGHNDKPLVVGHFISVADGEASGLTESELYDDENLLCLCAECNSGRGRETYPLRFLVAVLRARIAGTRKGAA